jgi:hypothetical protein
MSRRVRTDRAELAEALDRVLHKGAVLRGDVVISVAEVDLLYLDLRLFLSAVDNALEKKEPTNPPAARTDPFDSSRA